MNEHVHLRATVLLSEVFPPRTGGSGRWLWEIYRRLPREAVYSVVGEYPGGVDFDRETTMRIERQSLTFPSWGVCGLSGLRNYGRMFRRLRAIVRRENIAVVHCGKLLPEGFLAWLLHKWAGLPYLVYVHGEELPILAASRELRWMANRVFAGADRVIVNSRNTEGVLREGWSIPGRKLRLMHPGVDTRRFVPHVRDDGVRRHLGWCERRVILTVGRLQKRKGHDIMLRALPGIRCQVPNVLYSIVGDGRERTNLERLVQELGVGESVEFRGEPDDSELIRCYQQCDLFVLPNREVDGDFEGFGMVLVEAQACGKAVVAGDSGGTRETMRIPETGAIVDCREPEPLTTVVSGLLLDPHRCERMGAAGRDWAVERFDFDQLAKRASMLQSDDTNDSCVTERSTPDDARSSKDGVSSGTL